MKTLIREVANLMREPSELKESLEISVHLAATHNLVQQMFQVV
jgi:hypothetical protein